MPKYYFAVAEMTEEEDGTLSDAYSEVDFPYDVKDQIVIDFLVRQMPSLAGKLRPLTREEYLEHTEEEDENI